MGQVLPEIKRRREHAARFLLPDDQQQHTGYVYFGRADQHLDIQSIDIITATIRNYTGTVIAISHDNYFIREIGIEQRIVLS